MAWIELTITVGEIQAARGETPEGFISRALEGAGFQLETKLGRRLLVEPYAVVRHPMDLWITYRQWTGPGEPDMARARGDWYKGTWVRDEGWTPGPKPIPTIGDP